MTFFLARLLLQVFLLLVTLNNFLVFFSLESFPDFTDQALRVFLHQDSVPGLVVGEARDGAGRVGLDLGVGLEQRPLLDGQLVRARDLDVDVVVTIAIARDFLDIEKKNRKKNVRSHLMVQLFGEKVTLLELPALLVKPIGIQEEDS